jgi:hypothetical protein
MPTLDIDPGHPFPTIRQVFAAAREVPPALRDCPAENLPEAGADPRRPTVRAGVLAQELVRRGHGPAAAAWAVRCLAVGVPLLEAQTSELADGPIPLDRLLIRATERLWDYWRHSVAEVYGRPEDPDSPEAERIALWAANEYVGGKFHLEWQWMFSTLHRRGVPFDRPGTAHLPLIDDCMRQLF